MTSLDRHYARGLTWNSGAAVAAILAQASGTFITARLISPAGFGAYAAAQAVVSLAGYFALRPIAGAVIRDRTRSPEVASTAFLITAAGAVFVGGSTAALGGTWAQLWSAPEAAPLVRVLAIGIAASTLTTVPIAVLQRQLRFRAAAVVDASGQVSGQVAGVLLAILTRDPIGLALGQAAGLVCALTAGFALSGVWRGLRWRARHAGPLVTFSLKVSLQNFGYFVIYTTPAWLISRLFGGAALGMFSRANLMVALPLTYLTTTMTRALYPLYQRAGDDRAAVRALATRGIVSASGFAWPALAAVAGSAPIIVRVLLGTKWSASAEMLVPLAATASVNLVFTVLASAAEALGWLLYATGMQLATGACVAVAAIANWANPHSTIILLWWMCAAQVVAHVAQLMSWHRRRLLEGAETAAAYGVHGLIAVTVFGATRYSVRNLSLMPAVGVELALVAGFLFVLSLTRRHIPAWTATFGTRASRLSPVSDAA